jgi:hypothetical protein
MGWALYDGFEGQGYATEAAKAARDWAKGRLRLAGQLHPWQQRALRRGGRTARRRARPGRAHTRGCRPRAFASTAIGGRHDRPLPRPPDRPRRRGGAFNAACVPVLETESLRLRAPRVATCRFGCRSIPGPRAVQMGGPFDNPDATAWEEFAYYTGCWMLYGHGLWTIERRSTMRPSASSTSPSNGTTRSRSSAGTCPRARAATATPPRPPAPRATGACAAADLRQLRAPRQRRLQPGRRTPGRDPRPDAEAALTPRR